MQKLNNQKNNHPQCCDPPWHRCCAFGAASVLCISEWREPYCVCHPPLPPFFVPSRCRRLCARRHISFCTLSCSHKPFFLCLTTVAALEGRTNIFRDSRHCKQNTVHMKHSQTQHRGLTNELVRLAQSSMVEGLHLTDILAQLAGGFVSAGVQALDSQQVSFLTSSLLFSFAYHKMDHSTTLGFPTF